MIAEPATEPNQRRLKSGRWFGSLTVQVLLIALATRAFLFGVTWLALRAIPRLPLYRDQEPDSFLPAVPLLDGWARWDTFHYVRLALHGYGPTGEGTAFFPLFPLLMRGAIALSGLTPTPGLAATTAVALANLAFLAAVPLFANLVARPFGDDVARTATTLLCVSPFAFFFSAGYTESLFLLLVVLAFGAVERRWWIAAAACAALASATRLFGLALLPALLLLAWKRRAPLRDMVAIGVVSPLGTLAYMAWTWWRIGDPLAFVHAQGGWGGWHERVGRFIEIFVTQPWQYLTGSTEDFVIVINLAVALLFLATLPWVWKCLDHGIALFTTVIVVSHLVNTWISMGRYLLPAIGVYVVVALLLERPGWAWVRDTVLICSAIAMTMLAILFAHGFWVV